MRNIFHTVTLLTIDLDSFTFLVGQFFLSALPRHGAAQSVVCDASNHPPSVTTVNYRGCRTMRQIRPEPERRGKQRFLFTAVQSVISGLRCVARVGSAWVGFNSSVRRRRDVSSLMQTICKESIETNCWWCAICNLSIYWFDEAKWQWTGGHYQICCLVHALSLRHVK